MFKRKSLKNEVCFIYNFYFSVASMSSSKPNIIIAFQTGNEKAAEACYRF